MIIKKNIKRPRAHPKLEVGKKYSTSVQPNPPRPPPPEKVERANFVHKTLFNNSIIVDMNPTK